MNPDEQQLADALYGVLQWSMTSSPRATHERGHSIGVSTVGHCREYARRILIGEPATGTSDRLAAFLGTAIGDLAERALHTAEPFVKVQVPLTVTLANGRYELPGHADAIYSDGVLDFKTVSGLGWVQRFGPKRNQLYQRHLYCLGAHQAGLLTVPLAEAWTANAWIDRCGDDKQVHVHKDRYNQEIVDEATEWLDDVVNAIIHKEETGRDQPISFCRRFCDRFTSCRGEESVEEPATIEDPEALDAVDMYLEGRDLEDQGRRLKNKAKLALRDVAGSTGTYKVQWHDVQAAIVPEYQRDAYTKLSITPVK
jgi:hypothetical protein